MNERGARGRDSDEWLRAALRAARRSSPDSDRRAAAATGEVARCPDAELLAAYVENTLEAGERQAVEQHAAACDRCLETLGAIAASLGVVPEPTAAAAAPIAWWRRWSTWLVPATAAATALGLYLAVRPPGPPSLERTRETIPESQVARTTEPRRDVEEPEGKGDMRQKSAAAPAPGEGAGRAVGGAQGKRGGVPAPPAKGKDEAVERPSAVPSGVVAEQQRPADAVAPAKPAEERPQAPAQSDQARIAQREVLAGKERAGDVADTVPASPPQAAPQAAMQATVSNETRQARRLGAAQPLVEAYSAIGSFAWRFEPGPTVSVSQDGGATWQPAVSIGLPGRAMVREEPGAPPRVLAAAAPSDSVCWAVGTAGLVIVTTDGATWAKRSFPEETDLVNVSARDDRNANVVTRDGRRFETRDGGINWHGLP